MLRQNFIQRFGFFGSFSTHFPAIAFNKLQRVFYIALLIVHITVTALQFFACGFCFGDALFKGVTLTHPLFLLLLQSTDLIPQIDHCTHIIESSCFHIFHCRFSFADTCFFFCLFSGQPAYQKLCGSLLRF